MRLSFLSIDEPEADHEGGRIAVREATIVRGPSTSTGISVAISIS
jgi:hypothetical protein